MVRPVRVSIVAVVSVPIRAPMYPAINTGNAPWSEGTANHSWCAVHGQHHVSLRRQAKREGSCAQDAGEECSRSDSYYFRHHDLLSTSPPQKGWPRTANSHWFTSKGRWLNLWSGSTPVACHQVQAEKAGATDDHEQQSWTISLLRRESLGFGEADYLRTRKGWIARDRRSLVQASRGARRHGRHPAIDVNHQRQLNATLVTRQNLLVHECVLGLRHTI